jgi:tetratricopeptide (TPR) repeat protein
LGASYDNTSYVHTLVWVLWFQGFPDRAMRIVTQSVDDAIAGHAITLCRVLGHVAWPIAILVGDWVQAQRYMKLLLDLSINKRLWNETNRGHLYETWARGLEAGLMIKRGQADCGVPALRTALVEQRKANARLHDAILTVVLAEGLSASGQVAAALTVIDEALAESNASEVRWYMAEQLRIKGELILLTGAPNAAAEAESCYAQSLDLARRQGALSWELRTATSLARLRQRQGLTAEAMDVLQPVYARFTEGFRTPDLMAASTLLGTLQGATGAG